MKVERTRRSIRSDFGTSCRHTSQCAGMRLPAELDRKMENKTVLPDRGSSSDMAGLAVRLSPCQTNTRQCI